MKVNFCGPPKLVVPSIVFSINVGIVFANADTELLVPRFWSALIDRSLGALLYLQQICLE